MNDIIRMAQEAHRQLVTLDYPGHLGQLDPWTMQLLARFAALVRADEREQCIEIVDIHGGSIEIVAAIRARSEA